MYHITEKVLRRPPKGGGGRWSPGAHHFESLEPWSPDNSHGNLLEFQEIEPLEPRKACNGALEHSNFVSGSLEPIKKRPGDSEPEIP